MVVSWVGGGEAIPPRIVSPDQGSNDPITLADRGREDAPLVTLAVAMAGGEQNPIALHVYHHGVDGAFVALRVKSHGAYQFGACMVTILNQVSADRGADDGGEVHRVVW